MAEGFLPAFHLGLRQKVIEFSQDMTRDDVSSLQYLMKVPMGLREKHGTALGVLEYLEDKRVVCYDDPTTFVKIMRAMEKERWAVEMEKFIDSFRVTCATTTSTCSVAAGTPVQESVLPRPVQEQATMPAPQEGESVVVMRSTQSPEQKKSNSLNRTAKVYMHFPLPEESSDEEDDEEDVIEEDFAPSNCSTDATNSNVNNELSKSCSACTCCRNCYQECYDRLSKEFDQKVEDVFERCCAKFGHNHDSNSDSLERHAKLARTESSVSQKSTCSSGYGGSIYDPPIYIEPTITEESRQSPTTPDTDMTLLRLPESAGARRTSSSTASCSTLPSSPTTTIGSASRRSSSDGYLTPPEDEGEGSVFDYSWNSNSLCATQQQGLSADIINSPSLCETITKKMEVSVPDIKAAIDARNTNKVVLSDPFPILGKGPKFQLHLYPTNFEHTYSVLYLVITNWNKDEIPLELIMRVTVCELSESGHIVRDITSTVRPHSDKKLPPTPPNANFKRLLLFPSLIPHSYLSATTCSRLSVSASVTLRSS